MHLAIHVTFCLLFPLALPSCSSLALPFFLLFFLLMLSPCGFVVAIAASCLFASEGVHSITAPQMLVGSGNESAHWGWVSRQYRVFGQMLVRYVATEQRYCKT